MGRTFGRLAFARGKANLTGAVVDKDTGEQIPAKVQVTTSSGSFVHPDGSILKVGPGEPFFYCDGRFEVAVNRGPIRIVVVARCLRFFGSASTFACADSSTTSPSRTFSITQ